MTHTFTLSGLGEAPFTIVHPNTPKARENTAFFCEHCGTGLKNRFFVKSADGKVSVVGIDCLSKTGDQGLIDAEKRLRRQLRHEEREAKIQASELERQAADREKFDGKTREEVIEGLREEVQDLRDALYEQVFDHEATVLLKRGSYSPFEQNMVEKASKGEAFSSGMLKILVEIFAKKKSGARKNSKAYKEALPEAQALADSYQALIENNAAEIEAIQTRIRDLMHGR